MGGQGGIAVTVAGSFADIFSNLQLHCSMSNYNVQNESFSLYLLRIYKSCSHVSITHQHTCTCYTTVRKTLLFMNSVNAIHHIPGIQFKSELPIIHDFASGWQELKNPILPQ